MMAQNNQQVICGQGEQTRPYIYELDPLRTVTALAVVLVHVMSFTMFFNHTATSLLVDNGIFTSIHFTREIFMFVTALALAYVYYGKPFEPSRFWAKRSIGVLLPYCLWSLAYTWVNNPSQHSPGAFAKLALFNILTGNASYQLYYILLAIQFYIVLPLFLLLLKHIQKHPWRALLISFALQVLMMYLDYRYLQQGSLASSEVWQMVATYQNSFLLTYQFYFIFGGLAAVYLKQARAFVLSHGTWIVGVFVLGLVAVWVHFLLQVEVFHESFGYVTSVLQPMETIYSTIVIVLLCWLTCRWAKSLNQQGHPKWYGFWHALSDASFGIYLVHVFILNALLRWVVPLIPAAWPAAIDIFLMWFLTAGGAAGISVLLMKTPILSRLVGRSTHWRTSWQPDALHEWFSNPFHHQRQVEEKKAGDTQHV